MRDLLTTFGKRLGMQDARATGVIWARWCDIVGAQIAAHAEPSSLKNGVLRIRADSPAWATEIGYLGATIASAANRAAGSKMVDSVVVWTGPRPLTSGNVTGARESGVDAAANRRRKPIPEDPLEAFESAHKAWLKHRGRGSA